MEGMTTATRKSDNHYCLSAVKSDIRLSKPVQGVKKNTASAKRKNKSAIIEKKHSAIAHISATAPKALATRRCHKTANTITCILKQQASAKRLYEAIYEQEGKDIDKVVKGLSKIAK